jgi:hypothetical protein
MGNIWSVGILILHMVALSYILILIDFILVFSKVLSLSSYHSQKSVISMSSKRAAQEIFLCRYAAIFGTVFNVVGENFKCSFVTINCHLGFGVTLLIQLICFEPSSYLLLLVTGLNFYNPSIFELNQ